MQPVTKYAQSGDVNIAYQAIGQGPPDLVLVHGRVSNVDETWTEASLSNLQTRLASFSRLIIFDKRAPGFPTAS
jgi:pimeloyl-ACP methyl ester carboxylesterase